MPFSRSSRLSDAYHETIGALGHISSATSESDAALKYLQDEIEYLEEFGGQGIARVAGTGNVSDDLAVIRYAVAAQALSLEKLVPRITAVIEQAKEIAGAKALASATR